MKQIRSSVVNFIKKNWSTSFNNRIVYKTVGFFCICTELFPDNRLSSFRNFLPEHLILEGQGELSFFEKSYPSRYKIVTEGKFMFFKKKFKFVWFLIIETGFYPSITDIFETMNTLIQKRPNYSESCIKVKTSRGTQNEIYLAKEGSGLAFFRADVRHIFSSNVGNEFGVILRGKGPHTTEFVSDVVRIHTFRMSTYLIEYNIVGDTKTSFLRCFFSIQSSKLETL